MIKKNIYRDENFWRVKFDAKRPASVRPCEGAIRMFKRIEKSRHPTEAAWQMNCRAVGPRAAGIINVSPCKTVEQRRDEQKKNSKKF